MCALCFLHVITLLCAFFFFFTDPPPTEIYTLSLHDALPISLATLVVLLTLVSLRADYQKYAAVVYALSFIDRKSTRLNSSHVRISYAVFCLKKKTAV